MPQDVIVALISLAGSVLVACISYAAGIRGVREAGENHLRLIAYRLEALEKRVEKHNQLVERTFRLEERMARLEGRGRD